ncbi:YceI family protein [Spirosoma taeanense]|uniref:YceI family protein n=1 Tax=Spirosoma taeanense TaxID=2735870 RepID=A0A6M5Y5E5_9BACT|nr:YceI family protein [Spirosoma taeanense]QJW88313.1 YceI family protein [Spirosoma taeanense]
MKRFVLSAALVLAGLVTYAQTWSVDKAHAKLGFEVTHLMLSDVEGNFKTFDATINSAKDDFSDAVVELTADVNSIDTGNERRDSDLKSEKFFDAAKYPTLTFKSTSFRKVEGKKYRMEGNLTMHGVTKPVVLDVTLNGIGKNQRTQKPMAGFKITGMLKRSDFGVGTIPVAVVSDEVNIRANAEFIQN